ncbi:hypothetical protein AB0O31_10065 [Kitasatospora cineracea]|uniref:hypothetical protein n=1 Tax=Kitasatospora cineracea TaxID=88074 RepID=UPI0034414ECD
MTDGIDLFQIATSGAAAVAAEMATTGWEAFRSAIVRFLHRGGPEAAERELRVIDEARSRLMAYPEGERAAGGEELRRALFIQFAAFLQKYPEAASELQEIAAGVGEAQAGRQSRTSVHHNTNSQVVIAAGPVHLSGGMGNRRPGGAE